MLLTNYHTHTEFCDGKGSPADMLSKANQSGFRALGFSAHAPLPFENPFTLKESDLQPYIEAVNQLKNRGITEVYVGLEIDCLPGLITPADESWKTLGLDYSIGSVHALIGPDEQYPMLSVDGPQEMLDFLLDEVYLGDEKALIEAYYRRVADLCQLGGFDILGHYDLVKKHNLKRQFFNEEAPWYRDIVISTLDVVAQAGVIMEVNYGGMLRGATEEVYPPLWLLKEARKRHIPVQINADAHHPDHLGVHHQYSRELLLQAGYLTQRVLLGGKWQEIEL